MRLISIVLFCLLLNNTKAQKVQHTSTKPKLFVGLVIDQMRYDYLYRYANGFGTGGFNRLIKEGFNCKNTFVPYIPSVTACGHSCIYTGSVPAINGIANNDWIEEHTNKKIYCTQDDNVITIGEDGKSGKQSPKNLLTTTIGDELKLATNFRSKVIGVALKDRGSILPAGHSADAAFWMDDSLGNMITSSYYMQQLPDWVTQFNNAGNAKKYMQANWNLFYPIQKYTQSTADDNEYEGKFKHEKATSFPHLTSLIPKIADIKRTPFGNDLTLDFSKQAIINYKLGQGSETDFIAISLSSTDYVGHKFAINSLELEDTYYRLDKSIEDFLIFLDKQIGKNNYTLFLTADHGAAHNPKFLKDKKIPSGFFFTGLEKKRINEKALSTFGKNIIVLMADNEIWLNDSINKKDAINFIINEMQTMPEIQFAIDNTNLNNANLVEPIKTLAINSYNAKRSGDILYILNPAYIEAYDDATTGTNHGTWNAYDTHIPLIWFGNGIKKGTTSTQISMTDIAPTIADLLHIQMPNGCVGKVIEGVAK